MIVDGKPIKVIEEGKPGKKHKKDKENGGKEIENGGKPGKGDKSGKEVEKPGKGEKGGKEIEKGEKGGKEIEKGEEGRQGDRENPKPMDKVPDGKLDDMVDGPATVMVKGRWT